MRFRLSKPTADAAVAPPVRRRWIARALVRLPFALAGAGAILLAATLTYYTIAIPNPMTLRRNEPAPVIRVLAVDGSVLAERGQAYDYMPIDFLPAHVTKALIATEDRKFYEHWGVDPWGLLRAAFANLRAGRVVQGGSTLTQQLAKNLFLSSERRLGRKFEEMILALWLELRLSKPDILELYLNRVYFGGGAYGIEAAARRYFDKSARELTVPEAAVIAGLLKAPSKFAPTSNPALARQRARTVLTKMAAAGFLTMAEEKTALATPIKFTDPASIREPTGFEYAIDMVLERLPQLDGRSHGEIIVETTIDAKLQKRAQDIVQRVLDADGPGVDASQAGLVVLDTAGAIRAIVGGKSFAESQFNRALRARRQPGSAFKTFVYLAAIEAGMTPDTTAYDLPVSVNGWSPRNEGGGHRGAVSLRTALATSINTVAVRLHMDLGARKTVGVAQRLGIRSELRDGPSLALGTSEVTLMELASAYSVLANGGHLVEPHVIERVRVGSGQVLHQRPGHRARQVVAIEHVAAMNDMLNAALIDGTGRRAALARHPAAGKTGTSQDFRDAWFVGYTAHLVGGVWVGNDNGRAMNRVMGGTLPAKIWRDVMVGAHETLQPIPLPGTSAPRTQPATVVPTAARQTDDPIARVLADAERSDAAPGQAASRDWVSRTRATIGRWLGHGGERTRSAEIGTR
jgi:penicillin-binding protein 1A